MRRRFKLLKQQVEGSQLVDFDFTGVLDGFILKYSAADEVFEAVSPTGAFTSGAISDFAEVAQDSVGTILADGNTVNFTYTDATPAITAEVITQMSVTSDASGVKLSGDAASPGNSKYYGTNSGGTRGFHDLSASSGVDPATAIDWLDDFVDGIGSTGGVIWDEVVSGGSVAWGSPDEDHPGVVTLASGSGTTDVASIFLGTDATAVARNARWKLGTGILRFDALIRIPTVPTAAQAFAAQFGIADGSTHANLILGRANWDSGSSSVRWQLLTRSAGVTTTQTAATGAAANTWHTVRLDMTTSAVEFYVDGVLVLTNNTNIPTTTLSPEFSLAKSAGTTSRSMEADLVRMRKTFTSSRSSYL